MLQNNVDTIFINSGNSETPDPHRLLLNLFEKIKLKRNDKYIALSNLSIYDTWKNIKQVIQKQLMQKISFNVQ